VNGAVVLIGDAAHAMYPLGSNGASQAIVDARGLGASFVQHGVGRTALEDFESRWLEEMSALVLRNRRIGPASVLDFADRRAAEVFDADSPDSTAELERYVADYGTSVREAIERLNTAPPTIAPGARVRPG
jgi:2-polyprenyl-6-methoxyphenol hydroxylase-like FAD-dependent oxidoreductase